MESLLRTGFLFIALLSFRGLCDAQESIRLTNRMHHLRIDGPREWNSFPDQPEANSLTIRFSSADANSKEWSLSLTQEDIKQRWSVRLNGDTLGTLPIDENPMKVYFAIPPGQVRDGMNELSIEEKSSKITDDVRVGRIQIQRQSRKSVLHRATVRISVRDANSKQLCPSRITILNSDGALQTIGRESTNQLAVRPGIAYTSTGVAEFGLPPGTYTVMAGRGFEYSLSRQTFHLESEEVENIDLSIERQVNTAGYVACDTHVHTLTHSGHGDATVQERMVTLAAEGIELPIATDHNVHVDHQPFAIEANVRKYFTPVIGNEVTTPTGHFNIFPIRADARVPDHRSEKWDDTFREIFSTPSTKVAILNHGRDVHSGVTPLGPKLFNSASGSFRPGWELQANAMEVVNSSATQTDILQLFHDWMTLLNRGHSITPVGSSDSHDVGRHFVGQGRTYIRCNDSDPSNIHVDEAVENFLQGQVVVSYGLFVELTVNGTFRSGQVASNLGEHVNAKLRVAAPHWIQADRVLLYANGVEIESQKIRLNAPGDVAAMEWTADWTIDCPGHDTHLVAIATGPGISGMHWKTAKPYQPKSPDWIAQVIGCSGAIWLDVDGDSKPTNARRYAKRIVDTANGDVKTTISILGDYDRSVSIQAAELIKNAGVDFDDDHFLQALRDGNEQTRNGFRQYMRAWRESEIAGLNE